MHDVLAGYAERGELPGFVALVSRRGEEHVLCVGYKRDTIFRIASMTKPVVAVAACILVEEGVIRLDDPIDELVPELANLKVLRTLDAAITDTVPANRSITIRDLLTFTLGTGFIFAEAGTYPIQDALADSPLNDRRKLTPDEYLRALSQFPLMRQPGAAWLYNTGSEILAILVGRASGLSFGEFLKQRIFKPLEMKDTGFWVPKAKVRRLPTAYMPSSDGLKVEDDAQGGAYVSPPALESGGGGLVGTVDDFHAFARMLLRHGAVDSTRILARPTVEAMTTDQLSPAQKAASPWNATYWENHGWGWGVGVVTRRFEGSSTPGQYGWNGGYGTTWRSDPREDLIAILMTQVGMTGPEGPAIFRDFRTLAYAAIDD
ncbi:MAG TPA: serine hydrolase domain-containing protein [Candidatus Dormibacteraeota bacterium]|nr:serine hydrolase domain-containing protein [Candidatus Dormibacteraeota bacterium]